jgi:phosphoribosylformylglycinamidine cyclo-ligase
VLPVFEWLQEKGGVETIEMLRTYNMGIGFCFYVAADQVKTLLDTLAALGEPAWVIGQVVAGTGEVTVKGI